jgi:hypothetical protein
VVWHRVIHTYPRIYRPEPVGPEVDQRVAPPVPKPGGVCRALSSAVLRVFRRGPPNHALGPGERAGLLDDVCRAFRLGRLDEVRERLAEAGDRAAGDAACLNLLGVVCEARAEWAAARRYYGRAIRADRRFAPAQQNMRRLYELNMFGRSPLPVAVGDPATDQWLAALTGRRAAATDPAPDARQFP